VSFGDLPTFSDDFLEREATQFLQKHLGPDVPIPVDVELLIERIEGLDLDWWPALRQNYGVEGGVWRDADTGELFVYIDEKVMADDSPRGVGRYRTTVAEELAHVHLHRDVVARIDRPEEFQQLHNHIVGTRVERNAKRFAAALLMPTDKLSQEAKTVYRQLVQRVGTDNPGPVLKWLCSQLAQKFRVTEAAMNFRLQEMRVYEDVERALHRGYSNLP
jgi:hypothetical protein